MSAPKSRKTRTTELVAYAGLTLQDLSAFVNECLEEGWTGAAQVTVRNELGDRPGEYSTTTLSVSETR